MKVIANMLNTISILPINYLIEENHLQWPMDRSQFSSWLSGFIDGEGNLTYKISQYVNSNRYSTNPNQAQAPSLTEINKVLNLNLPVTLSPSMLHVDLAKAFASKVKPSAIWVYDNGVLLNGNPFSSFASAMGYSKN